MQILRELVQIVNRVKLRAIRKLGFPLEDDNRLSELYELLADDAPEEDILRIVTDKSEKTGDYRRLKSELSERLIASLFLIDLNQPSYNDRQRAYYAVHKDWTAAKILLGKNARAAAVELCERVWKTSVHYEFNDLAHDVARHLRLLYGTSIGDLKKYDYYDQAAQALQETVIAESRAEQLYTRLIMHYVRNDAGATAISQQASIDWMELAPILQRSDAYTLHLYASLIRLIAHTANQDHTSALEVCDETITFFEKKDYSASVPLQAAYYQKLLSLLELRRFKESEQTYSNGLSLFGEGSYNWFKFQQTYLLLALQSGEFAVAYATFIHATEHNRFQRLPETIQEYWRILEAYLQYLYEINKLPQTEENKRFSKFRIARFINQTPIFSKDKSGINVSILIIQILFSIARKNYGETTDKIEAVEQYCRRYLFKENTLRAFYLIKALLEIPKNGFHRAGVQRKAEKYLTKMKNSPLERATEDSMLIEIIPFPQLWDWLMEQLPEKFFRPK